MKNKSWFYKPATGLNADIKRHMEKESELRERLALLEPDNDTMRRALTHFLYKLQDSKAEVVSQIGK